MEFSTFQLRKQHKTLQSIQLFFLLIMIFTPSGNSHQSCNVAVKMTQIYSPFSNGYLRTEKHRVVAKGRSPEDGSDYEFYQVTIDKHYFLLFHKKNGRFICWNKSYTRLLAKRNPPNLAYCKFEEKMSLLQPMSHIRYTTTDHRGKEVEIRFSHSGMFFFPTQLKKCLRSKKATKPHKVSYYMSLNPLNVGQNDSEMTAYRNLSQNCANPDFLPRYTCNSYLKDFCHEMKARKVNGHKLAHEFTNLCEL